MQDIDARIARQVGAGIRPARAARRWSQAELAERLDVSVDYVGLLERGERVPSLTMLSNIARILGLGFDVLLGGAPGGDDAWIITNSMLLRSVPLEARPVVGAMLRAAASERGASQGRRPPSGRRTRRG